MRFTIFFIVPALLISCFITCGSAAGPEMPSAPDEYQAKIEFNYPQFGFTEEIEDSFSNQRQMGRLKRRMDGIVNDTLINYKTNEIFHMQEGLPCHTDILHGNHSHFLFHPTEDGHELTTLAGILSMPQLNKVNMTFAKTDVVRGIDVNCWTGELLHTPPHHFTMYYCWSIANKWKDASQIPEVPVLARFVYRINNTEVSFEAHITFFQLGVRTDEYDELFQTPEGVYCFGRNTTTDIPKLPDTVVYNEEMGVSDGPVIHKLTNGKIQFDKVLKLVSFDHRDSQQTPPFFSLGGLKIIHDFTTGVAYYKDNFLGNCTDRPIGIDLFDVKDADMFNNTKGIHWADLRDPNELFHIDNTYQYVGKRLLRGIPAEYYITQKANYSIKGLGKRNTTFELYFLDRSIVEIPNGQGLEPEHRVPLHMKITAFAQTNDPTQTYKESYNFFNFDATNVGDMPQGVNPEEPGSWTYDVTDCYEEGEVQHIRIYFSGMTYMPIMRNSFVLFALQKLRERAGPGNSPLRFQRPELDYNSTHVFITFTLLDRAHLYAQFIGAPLKAKNFQVDDVAHVDSIFSCKLNCTENKKINCSSVSFCQRDGSCSMSVKQYHATDMEAGTDCQFATRPVKSQGAETGLDDLVEDIKAFVESKKFSISIPMSQDTDTIFSAVGIDDDILRPNGPVTIFPTIGRHMQMFTETKRRQIQPTRSLDGVVLADDCARTCLNDPSQPACQSFTYCFKDGLCHLSAYTPDATPQFVLESSACNLYTKNNLARYREFPGKVVRKGSSYKGTYERNADACAKKCTDSGQEKCLSFDFCNEGMPNASPICYLNKAHNSDAKDTLADSVTCRHFSKSYSVDFKTQYTGLEVSLSSYATFKSDNEDACARICVEKYGEKCKGYHFCGGAQDDTCAVVLTDQSEMAGAGRGKLTCEYKERIFLADGSPYTSRLQTVKQGLGTGGAFGLAIGMILLGALIMALLFLFIPKLRTASDDMRVYFHKDGQRTTMS